MAELGTANIGGRAVPAWVLESTAEQVDNSKWFSRPNLLYNWYFVGGGSQQGGGQFPINQRGQTSYTGAVYGIDRWTGLYGSELVALENDCLSLTFSGNQGISQSLDSDALQALEGQTVTQTILWYLSSGNYANAGLVVNETAMLTPGIQSVGGQWMITSNTVQMPDSIQSASFNISGDGNIKAKAVKLELGDHQTLAYQDEDGNWQLFETLDYGEELAKCQAYQVVINTLDIIGGTNTATTLYANIPTPVTMRALPAIENNGVFNVRGGGTNQANLTAAIYSTSLNANGIRVGIAGQFTVNEPYHVSITSPIILNANL